MNMEKCRYEESCGHEYCNLTDCPEYEAIPITNADFIRGMSDIELAKFLEQVMSERDAIMSERLTEQGVPNSLISMPTISIAHHLAFLRRPAIECVEFEGSEGE